MLTAYGAFDDEKLIGIIATRNAGSHIALFFVDGAYHHQGIGRSLWNAILEENAATDEYYSCFDDFSGLINAKAHM